MLELAAVPSPFHVTIIKMRVQQGVSLLLVFGAVLMQLGEMALVSSSTRGRNQMYFAIAAASANGQAFSRAFNKTLANITQAYHMAHNVTVEPLVIELPDGDAGSGFSGHFLRHVCDRFERRHVVAVLIVGNTRAAFTVALAAGHAGVPVLWARGINANLPGLNNLVSSCISSVYVSLQFYVVDHLLFKGEKFTQNYQIPSFPHTRL